MGDAVDVLDAAPAVESDEDDDDLGGMTISDRVAAIAGVVGALLFAIVRSVRDDFDGGWLETLEWAALGAAFCGGSVFLIIRLVGASSWPPAPGRRNRGLKYWALSFLRNSNWWSYLRALVVAVALVGLTWAMLSSPTDIDRLASTIRVVVMAVVIVGGLWIGLNLLSNLAGRNWPLFAGLSGAIVGGAFFAALRGNLSVKALVADENPILFGAGSGFLGHVEWPIYGIVVWGGGLYLMRRLPMRAARLGLAAGMGILTGYLIGTHVQLWQRPEINWLTVLLWTVLAGAIGAGLSYRSRDGDFIPGAIAGAAVGWTIGTWFRADFAGSENEAVLAAAVPLVLLAVRIAWPDTPTPSQLSRFDARSRAFIFLGPALAFLSASLVIPAISTIYLSLLDRDSEEYVGFDNYRELWNDTDSFDFTNWDAMFTSQLFWLGVALLVTGVIIGLVTGQKRNGVASFEGTGASMSSIAIALILVAFAVLSVIRGTFFNNIWWVITVTSFSTVLGLTIAVLAERAGRFENFAKSLIFMPMAVSFVGASIVWRLQYQPRDPRNEQTGVLNAVWVMLGKISRAGEDGNTYPAVVRYLVLLALAAVVGYILYKAIGRARAGETFTVHTAGLVVFGYLLVEIARRSLGGFDLSTGEVTPDTILFVQEPPFNNVFLMIILIWIQTGFAMVILSAAIKAVPTEFIEAARVDGATESQTFFRVILPQIMPTVGVVVTTLIVLVTKVFDIVKVTTGGNFGTNVLANDMFNTSFNFFNRGLGSAIAVFILISVLPVMFLNIRRMQKARLH